MTRLHHFFFLLLLLAWTGNAAAQRPKVGVVLSGGGAKGVAHIGALRVIEEAGIPVDYIVGTSMGAIVGGLHAIGYSAKELDSIVRQQNWPFILSDKIYRFDLSPRERADEERYLLTFPIDRVNPRSRRPVGLVSGQNILNTFTQLTIGYHENADFSRFPIPFRCVAADIVRQREVVISSGDLPLAMRASMAIPGFFTPVRADSALLVDGGILNNFPADVVRDMGADVIIGVDVHADLMKTEELTNISNSLPQLVNLLCMNKYKENTGMVDLLVRPDLRDFSAADFNARAIDSLLARGERAARAQWDNLMLLKNKHGLDNSAPRTNRLARASRFPVSEIILSGLAPEQERWIRAKLPIKEGNLLSIDEIHRAVNILYNTRAFSSVNYRLTGDAPYRLTFAFAPHPMSYLNVGARFDSEETGAILFNATLSNSILPGSRVALTSRLSRYPYLRAELSLENSFSRRVHVAGEFRFSNVNIYNRGRKRANVIYRYYLGELSVYNYRPRNVNIQAGARYELFDYKTFLFADDNSTEKVHPEHFFSYFVKLHLDNLDKPYFPERGLSLESEIACHTDNFISYRNATPFASVAFHLRKVLPVAPGLKNIVSLHARSLIGQAPAYSYYNHVGGVVPGRHTPRQIPFWGIKRLEIFDNSMWTARMELRRKFPRAYFSLLCNVAQQDDDLTSILSKKLIYGGGLSYSRPTRFGPAEVILTLSNWTKRPNLYINWGFYF